LIAGFSCSLLIGSRGALDSGARGQWLGVAVSLPARKSSDFIALLQLSIFLQVCCAFIAFKCALSSASAATGAE